MSLPAPLEVGRVTFALFSKIEWLAAAPLAVSLILGGHKRFRVVLTAALLAILAVQAFWLLPALDMRVEAVIAGRPQPATWHHLLYAAGECVQAILLFLVSFFALWDHVFFQTEASKRPEQTVSPCA